MTVIKTVLAFFVSGLLFGGVFGWLLSIRQLTAFWFRKGDKFLVPTYRYYLGIGGFLLLSLALGYSISLVRGWILKPPHKSLLRYHFAALIVATSALLVYLATAFAAAAFRYDPVTAYLIAVVAFVLLISIACWILTAKLYYPGLLVNLMTIPIAFALLYFLANMLSVPSEWSETVTYPVYCSVLAAACGFWISRIMNLQHQLTG